MSRYNTQVLSSIRMLCRMRNINEKVLYERAKLILSIYREVCWSTIDRANDVCDTLICTYGDSLDGALIYLENFAPDEARERFEERIRSLFETKWIIELVDMAMLKIREYPDKGALYCEIISKAYLNRFKYRESEMLEVLNMERSTYYDRKKEAILLFGLSLWGTAIPKLKDFLESAREEEALTTKDSGEEGVLGEDCLIDCSQIPMIYCNYDTQDMVDITLDDLQVGDEIILTIRSSEIENLQKEDDNKGKIAVEQLQLGTQRIR